MTLREFNRRARHGDLRAVIISDGCRDYVIEAHTERGSGVINDYRGRRKRFASLAEARRAVRRASRIELAIRVAADEACAGTTRTASPFAHLTIVGAH